MQGRASFRKGLQCTCNILKFLTEYLWVCASTCTPFSHVPSPRMVEICIFVTKRFLFVRWCSYQHWVQTLGSQHWVQPRERPGTCAFRVDDQLRPRTWSFICIQWASGRTSVSVSINEQRKAQSTVDHLELFGDAFHVCCSRYYIQL